MLAATRFEPVASDDHALVARVVARDAEALAELYDRYGRVVFGVLHRMLPSPEAAEEVCQDVFDRFWRAAASYRQDRAAVRTWLLAIARNAAIDWRRTKGKRVERESELGDAIALPATSVEDLVDQQFDAVAVRTLLARLPVEQRDCLILAFWHGYSQSEIAALTATPVGTIKSRVRLGMQKLRMLLLAHDHALQLNR